MKTKYLLKLDVDLHREIKIQAATSRKTFNDLICEILAEWVKASKERS
jgi:predicted HicB family RNase H-like nuclease